MIVGPEIDQLEASNLKWLHSGLFSGGVEDRCLNPLSTNQISVCCAEVPLMDIELDQTADSRNLSGKCIYPPIREASIVLKLIHLKYLPFSLTNNFRGLIYIEILLSCPTHNGLLFSVKSDAVPCPSNESTITWTDDVLIKFDIDLLLETDIQIYVFFCDDCCAEKKKYYLKRSKLVEVFPRFTHQAVTLPLSPAGFVSFTTSASYNITRKMDEYFHQSLIPVKFIPYTEETYNMTTDIDISIGKRVIDELEILYPQPLRKQLESRGSYSFPKIEILYVLALLKHAGLMPEALSLCLAEEKVPSNALKSLWQSLLKLRAALRIQKQLDVSPFGQDKIPYTSILGESNYYKRIVSHDFDPFPKSPLEMNSTLGFCFITRLEYIFSLSTLILYVEIHDDRFLGSAKVFINNEAYSVKIMVVTNSNTYKHGLLAVYVPIPNFEDIFHLEFEYGTGDYGRIEIPLMGGWSRKIKNLEKFNEYSSNINQRVLFLLSLGEVYHGSLENDYVNQDDSPSFRPYSSQNISLSCVNEYETTTLSVQESVIHMLSVFIFSESQDVSLQELTLLIERRTQRSTYR